MAHASEAEITASAAKLVEPLEQTAEALERLRTVPARARSGGAGT
jgi:hypothetical protein